MNLPDPADRPLVVYGAGGHGVVVGEAASLAGWHVLGFIDDAERGSPDQRWPLLALEEVDAPALWIVAIGSNAARARVIDRLVAADRQLATVVHPTAIVSPTADVADGVFIGPGAIVQARTSIGRGALLNTGCIIEHHSRIGECAHVAPGAALGGCVSVGDRALVGLGARVMPSRNVGRGAVVGAGAVVTRDVPDDQVVIGTPARTGERHD